LPVYVYDSQRDPRSAPQFDCDIHLVVVTSTFHKALQTALEIASRISVLINTNAQMLALIKSSIGTKFVARSADLI
jgi:T-complex protein 1 subunit gamma